LYVVNIRPVIIKFKNNIVISIGPLVVYVCNCMFGKMVVGIVTYLCTPYRYHRGDCLRLRCSVAECRE